MSIQFDPEAIEIGGISIGLQRPPIIVAEMSGNHNQSLDRAMRIVEEVARAGADALKLQTYTADAMTLDLNQSGFRIENPNSPWNGYSLFQLYQEAHTPWEWHEPIFRRCKDLGLLVFSTPFDTKGVEFLEQLAVPAFKIASFENADIPLIRRIAKTGKPILMSTGMASVAELDESVRAIRGQSDSALVLLKCTSTYPAPVEDTNVRTIPHLRELFGLHVGLSDHTPGIGVALAAIAQGATVIEKHVTLRRSEGGVDAAFSLEPSELHQLVIESKRAWASLGSVSYGVQSSEQLSMQFRRSLYCTTDMAAGDSLTAANMRAIRPGYGLPPKYYDMLLGRRVKVALRRGTPLSWNVLE